MKNTSDTEIPDIDHLSALVPVEDNGKLTTPNLEEHIKEYRPHEANMWSAFEKAEPDTIEEVDAGARLAAYYLLRNSAQLQDDTKDHDKALWANRFTEASRELFGDIDAKEASGVAATDLEIFEQVDGNSFLVEIYRKIAVAKNESNETPDLEPATEALKEIFASIFELADHLPEGPFDASATNKFFEEALGSLRAQDSGWEGWKVIASDRETLSVESITKTIDVPTKRGPIDSKVQLLGLALHEIGVHATRGKNGYKHEDKLMTTGIFGYGDFEEGLGVMFEYLATGVIPDKIKDRYVDIALATEVFPGVHLTRDELIKLGIEREQFRAQAQGETVDEKDTKEKVLTHVNRIFRGGTGEMIDNEGERSQAVLTKDLIYFEGFVSAKKYIQDQIASGVDARVLLEFLLEGKFDPTKPKHIKHVSRFVTVPDTK